MKRLLLFFLIVPCLAFSQTKHMEFKGVQIDGHIDEFVSKMEELGFEKEKDSKNAVIMTGEFVGKSCELFILHSPASKTVWKVAVFLDKQESWSGLKSDYKYYKDQYSTKYGKPEKFEFFSKPYYEGDGYEIQALRKDKCTYVSYWKVEEGTISVEISSTARVLFSYEDGANGEKTRNEKESNIQDDI